MLKRMIAVAVVTLASAPAMAGPFHLPALKTTVGGLVSGAHAGGYSVFAGELGNLLPIARKVPITQAPGTGAKTIFSSLPGLPKKF